MKIQGKVFLLDRSNVDTDQIIPACYLDCVSIQGLGNHLFEGMPDFYREDKWFKECQVLVVRDNFGMGSSREHAVWALESHGFRAVIASSFARIFRQNAFNRGLLAVELTPYMIDRILRTGFSVADIDVEAGTADFSVPAIESLSAQFRLSEFDLALMKHGGLVGFVAEHYKEEKDDAKNG